MVNGKSLKLKSRREIYEYIINHPGLHLGELARKMDIPKSTLNYHLNCLKKNGYIIEKTNNRYNRYYITNGVSENDKDIMHLLRQDVPYKIILFLMLNPDSSQKKISGYLDKHPTTVSYHINKLMETDLIECIPNGNEIKYRIKNKDDISRVFIKYKESFLDNMNMLIAL